MPQYDGSIRVDTRIDAKGFNNGVKGLLAALKPLGIAIGAIFGVRAIVNFGQSAVSEAAKMSSALVGLQSIVEGTGNSFNVAQDFINSYVSDGLIPAQNAITSYKNLLLRGYDTSQIEQTLTALKDSAAFGRQGSLTLGRAVESATEGLKNENSILVDNAGVTKNVSLIWKDYATSIGTTVGALTKAQKIQAEVAGIMEETRFQTGDAAKLAGTYSGQISALGVSFLNLKIAIGNAIIPIIQAVLPYIKAAVDALTIFFNRVASIIGILFGVDIGAARQSMEGLAGGTQAAADAQGELAKNTEAAGKAAKGALAPFDELNILAQDSGSGAGDAPGVADVGGGVSLGELDTSTLDDGLDELRAKVEAWKESFLNAIQPVSDAFGRLMDALVPVKDFVAQGLLDFYNNFLVPVGGWVLGEGLPRFIDAIANGLSNVDWGNINDSLAGLWDALAPFAINVGDGLLWFWENVLVPLGTYVINDLLPTFLDGLAGIIDILNQSIEDMKPYGQWLWDHFLQPIASWTGGVIADALDEISEAIGHIGDFLDDHPNMSAIIGAIGIAFLLSSTGAFAFAAGLWATLSPILLLILAIGGIAYLINHWGDLVEWFKELWERAWTSIKDWWDKTWTNIKEKWNSFWDGVNEKITNIKKWFSDLWGDLRDGWNKMMDGFKSKWDTTWTGIKDFVKNIINIIIDFINGMIRAVAGGMNAVIDSINSIKVSIPSWIPVIGGKSFGVSIPRVSAPQIPRLATGAVIPPNAEFLALLGDQKSGRNIEAPEAAIRKIVEDALANAGDREITLNSNVYLDGEKIYTNQQKISRRRGTSLVNAT